MIGVLCDGNGIELRDDLPEPVAGLEETLLRVRSVGICDTDLQLARGYMKFRGILGHEFVGELADGRRVTVATEHGEITVPVRVTAMPDRVVWLPTHARDCEIRRQLRAGHGTLVTLRSPQ